MLSLIYSDRWPKPYEAQMSAPEYDPFARIGTYDHGSVECVTHGDNVLGFRMAKQGGARSCVACSFAADMVCSEHRDVSGNPSVALTIDQPAPVQPRKVAGDDDDSFWAL